MNKKLFNDLKDGLHEIIDMKSFKPRDYQHEAIDAAVNHFKDHDRATIVMACGTGKTLVALWTLEALNVQNIIVFMPSLALIKQTITSWKKYTKLNNASFMAVCSEKRMFDDEFVVSFDECDFAISTEDKVIQRFLHGKSENKIVFCTYQSADTIPNDFQFDLGIFDEAHKTASKNNVLFRHSLYDHHILITKRLFMTATPKHYKYSKATSHNMKQLEYSMDNKDIYGEIIYRLDFAEAIKKNIICDYKVIISIISNHLITQNLLKNGITKNKSKKIKTINIAHAISLHKACNEYSINKAITYHNSIKEAIEFKDSLSSLNLGNNIKYLHVNGSMDTVKRNQEISTYQDTDQAIITNVRCLSEGVDFPETDLVCFMSPKHSKVDIIQTIGRVMRKHRNKEFGYVLVPIYYDTKTNSINTSEYSNILDLLNTLREYDAYFDKEIRISFENRSNGAQQNNLLSKINFINCDINIDDFIESIHLKLYNQADSWEDMYQEAHEYKNKHGNLYFTNEQIKESKYKKLNEWIRWVRVEIKKGNVSGNRLSMAREIGLDVSPQIEKWYQRFFKLKKEFSKKIINEPRDLSKEAYKWIDNNISYMKRKGSLDQHNQEFVDFIKTTSLAYMLSDDFKTTKHGHFINRLYKQLIKHQSKYGNLDINSIEHNDLYLKVRRYCTKKNQFSTEHQKLIELFGIDEKRYSKKRESMVLTWDDRYKQALSYYNEHGSLSFNAHKSALKNWVVRQRQFARANKLSKEQFDKLDKIKFLEKFYQRIQSENE